MKIGIITFWESDDNYGQILQCFALQKHLKNMGHMPFLIRYRDVKYTPDFKLSKIFRYIKHFKAHFEYLLQLIHDKRYQSTNQNVDRKFAEFRLAYLTMTSNIYDSKTIESNIPEADAYICGSDQIWGGSYAYYLSFVPDNKLKIAYAPSFGGTNPFMRNDKDQISKLLGRFAFIGMREKSGAVLLNENGFTDSTQVVDPTLLLDREEYDSLVYENSECANQPKKDAFIYLLGSPVECDIKDVFSYIEKLEYTYTYVASQGRMDSYNKSPLTIPQWINGIKNTRLVVTNSFHCIVFSLIYHKPFIYLPLAGSFSRMNDRLNDLLSNCDLQNQIYHGKLDDISLNLDFKVFNQYKLDQTKRSFEILNSLLKKP